jgi:hypothetical protein
MQPPRVNNPQSIADFLSDINDICNNHNVTGMVVVLSINNGDCITTHQFGMDNTDLAISAQLMNAFASGDCTNFTTQ